MKRSTSILFLIFLLHAFVSVGQHTLSGNVTARNGESLPGVNLWIDGTFDGGTSDANGHFSFQTSKNDSLILVASAIGYGTVQIPLISALSAIPLVLQPKVNELNAVSITVGTIDVSDKASAVVMRPLDILTTAGAVGDITGALNTLPGTATVANDGRLFVRGGDASETAIFFDGLRVGNAYGTSTANVPTRNRFSPALFKGTFFSTGGYSAEYGDALSSVLVLETVDQPVRNQTDISLMSVGASVSSTLAGKKQSLTAEASYQNLAPYQELVTQDFDWEKAPLAYSGQAVYRHKWGADGMVKAFVQGSKSKMVIWQKQADDESRGQRIGIGNDFGFANVTYRKPMNEKWLAEGGFSITANTDGFDIDTNRFENEENLIHFKQKITHYLTDALKIKGGFELIGRSYRETELRFGQKRGFDDKRTSVFAEAEWFLSTRLTLRTGIRGAAFSGPQRFSPEPRLAAAFMPYKNGTISLAAGRFSQVQDPAVITISPEIGNAAANHYQLSYQHGNSDRLFRMEGYYKTYSGLRLIQPVEETLNLDYAADGSGVAQGFDLFFRDRKSVKNLDYWVTYSFVHSRRQYDRFETQVQPSFAPQHNLSVVGKYWIAKWNSLPGATFTLNSGYSYDNPNLAGEMESLSPGFGSLSLNWSYLPRPSLIIHLSCTNITGRDNVFGYRYANEAGSDGFYESTALRQPAPRFVFVGVFWTISSDKKANQLNNL